ncbi:RHS repeat-associated core domain-containing protein [Granulicella rosea]|uniref:RHS repeat-associated core domain-containing protein n=1 Tax=Granulicella rosea TaxID=474952 RepID=A0A239MQL6_9BACT|nr:LamG-like jellyroll fold domain-containing protein [Granulicella rosea]SNT44422.1 RHS repeat-associated core domain-containing protein [Granulicella rosea]
MIGRIRQLGIMALTVLILCCSASPAVAQIANETYISSLSLPSGIPGDSITLTGYFGPTQAIVTLNGAAMPIVSWGNFNVVVTVPIGGTTGDIVVNLGGTLSNGVPFAVDSTARGYSRPITIHHSSVTSSLQDFPLLFAGTYTDLATVANGGKVQNQYGYDIAFTSDQAGRNPLDFEIDAYDPVAGKVAFWIRIPSLSNTADTTIYMWYGYPHVYTSLENKSGVWKSNYLSIYHFGNGAQVGTSDSGMAGYTLYASSPGTVAGTAPGVVGNAAAFGATSAALGNGPVTLYPGNDSPATIEAWVNLPTDMTAPTAPNYLVPPSVQIVSYGHVTADGAMGLWWNGGSPSLLFGLYDYMFGGTLTNDGNWHHVVGVYAGGSVLDPLVDLLYVDGNPINPTEVASGDGNGGYGIYTQSNPLTVGGPSLFTNGYPFIGSVDEVRISSGTRSAAWIQAEYANISNPNSFYMVGAVSKGPVINSVNPNPVLAGAAVRIGGSDFGAAQGASSITLNGVPLSTTSWNNSSIALTVPFGASSGNLVVTVQGVPSNTVSLAITNSPPPVINAINPTPALPGTVISVIGSGFGAVQGTSTIALNGTVLSTYEWTDTLIRLKVPAGATTGSFIVTVQCVNSNAMPLTTASVFTGYERTITIDHTKVPNTDQSSFPVLIAGTYPYLATSANGGKVQNANGYDIVFTSDAAGQDVLDYEIDTYNPVSGAVAFWVRIQNLSHTADTVIYMWYGIPNVTASQENPQGTWRNNYLSVYHLGDGATVGTSDSGYAGYDLSGSAAAISGKIGGAAGFNGSTATYLSHPTLVEVYPSGSMPVTLESWVQLPSNTPNVEFLGYGSDLVVGSRVGLSWNNNSQALLEFNQIGVAGAGSMTVDGAWHHLVGVYGGGPLSATADQLYVDGVLASQGIDVPIAYKGILPDIQINEFKIGGIPTVTSCCALNGSVDEVRISSVTRSADWVATEYANQSSPATFYNMGSEAAGGVSSQPSSSQTTYPLTCIPQTVIAGTAVSCSVSLPSGATGSVAFSVDQQPWVTSLIDGSGLSIATSGFTGATVGAHTVSFSYPGDGANPPAVGDTTVGVLAPGSTLTGSNIIYQYSITKPDGTSGYDANGNILSYADSVNGQWQMGYDSLNRLTTASVVPAVRGYQSNFCWAYDAFGNRTSQIASDQPILSEGLNCVPHSANWSGKGTVYNGANQPAYDIVAYPASPQQFMAQPLQLDAAGNATAVYDELDNNIETSFLYDGEGRVCAVASAAGMFGYIYDASGARVAKGTLATWSCDPTSSGYTFTETAGYMLGPNGEQVTETDGSGNVVHTNVFANGQLIATYANDGLHYHLSDWLGTQRVQTDASGNSQMAFASMPFGEMLPTNVPTPSLGVTEQHFTGKERDQESGLDYFGARHLVSGFGRWLSPDSLNLTDDRVLKPANTLNKYIYAANNPFKYIDVDGKDITVFYEAPSGISSAGHIMFLAGNQSTGGAAAMSFGPVHDSDYGLTILGAPVNSTTSFVSPGHTFSADDIRQNFSSLTIQTSPEDTQKVIDFIHSLATTGNPYMLFKNNCTTTCVQALKIIGLLPGSNSTITPKGLWNDLFKKHADPYWMKTYGKPLSRPGFNFGSKPNGGYDSFQLLEILNKHCTDTFNSSNNTLTSTCS